MLNITNHQTDHKYKRKRVKFKKNPSLNSEEEEEEEEDEEESLDDDESNSSTASSVVSIGSINVKPIKHGHKLLITEENMSQALNNLQLEIDTSDLNKTKFNCKNEKKIFFDIFDSDDDNDDDDDDADDDDNKNCFLISDELKSKLKEYNLINQLKHEKTIDFDLNRMQLIPWTPKLEFPIQNSDQDLEESLSSSSSASSSQSYLLNNSYKVEEPSDILTKQKNKLKRKYSQLNKICIEEMTNDFDLENDDNLNRNSSFYLVEQEDEAKHFHYNNGNNFNNNDFKITEVYENNRNGAPKLQLEDEEQMEVF